MAKKPKLRRCQNCFAKFPTIDDIKSSLEFFFVEEDKNFFWIMKLPQKKGNRTEDDLSMYW